MRNTRALIAGLGTSGSLVAAAACAFLVASAVIAFKGWPGTGIEQAVDNLFVDDAPAVAWDLPGTDQVAADAAVAAGAVAATPTGPAFGPAGSFPVLGGSGSGSAGTPQSGGGSTGATPSGSGGATAVVVAGGSTGGGSGESIGILNPTTTAGGAGRTVTGITNDVGNTVGAVSPELGKTVKRTGRELGTTVDGVTGVRPGG